MNVTQNIFTNWRTKAIQRRLENKELKKRIKELKKSRDGWKAKSQKVSSINKKIKHEIDLIKKKLLRILT